ncbi:MAG: type II secretion system protein [Phycisphaerales bacterium JB041]
MTGTTRRARHAAFTLMEVMLALALATVVLGALQSLIMISGRAIPDTDGVQASTVGASDALERLAAEFSVAVEVLEVTPRSITFSVNDWTGDDRVETIKYGWSGVAGEPLLRAINGGSAAVLVESVESFSLTPGTSSIDVKIDGTETELNDRVVQSMDVLDLFADGLSGSKQYAQRLVPDLPADTVEWRVATVSIWVTSGGGSSGDLTVELRKFDTSTGYPTDSVYKSKDYNTSALGNGLTRIDLPFDSSKMGPNESVCLVVRAKDAGVSCVFVCGSPVLSLGGRSAFASSDGGRSWSSNSNKVWRHEVTADIWTDTGRDDTRTTMHRLDTSLATGSPLTTITRSVRPLNTPEVLP